MGEGSNMADKKKKKKKMDIYIKKIKGRQYFDIFFVRI